jgi:hypothetical protein
MALSFLIVYQTNRLSPSAENVNFGPESGSRDDARIAEEE